MMRQLDRLFERKYVLKLLVKNFIIYSKDVKSFKNVIINYITHPEFSIQSNLVTSQGPIYIQAFCWIAPWLWALWEFILLLLQQLSGILSEVTYK